MPRFDRRSCARPIFVAAVLVGIMSCQRTAAPTENHRGSPGSVQESSPNAPSPVAREEKQAGNELTHLDSGTQPNGTNQQQRSPAEKPSPAGPEQVTEAWLESLRKRDLGSLTMFTRVPFTLHDREWEKNCPSGRATDAEELAGLLGCITQNNLFVEDLAIADNKSPLKKQHVKGDFPMWARRWRLEVTDGLIPVSVNVFGNGVFHELVVLVGSDGVHALWRNTTYEPN
jgi:hypothetical protein